MHAQVRLHQSEFSAPPLTYDKCKSGEFNSLAAVMMQPVPLIEAARNKYFVEIETRENTRLPWQRTLIHPRATDD